MACCWEGKGFECGLNRFSPQVSLYSTPSLMHSWDTWLLHPPDNKNTPNLFICINAPNYSSHPSLFWLKETVKKFLVRFTHPLIKIGSHCSNLNYDSIFVKTQTKLYAIPLGLTTFIKLQPTYIPLELALLVAEVADPCSRGQLRHVAGYQGLHEVVVVRLV